MHTELGFRINALWYTFDNSNLSMVVDHGMIPLTLREVVIVCNFCPTFITVNN